MKKLLLFITLLYSIATSAQVKISNMQESILPADEYYFPAVKDGQNYRIKGKYVSKTRIDSLVGAVAAITLGSTEWGDLTGALSAQTDLQNALNAKVPTSRTITIGENTYDLSANRTFALTKLDVGLGNLDNTSDLSKPISNAVQAALDALASATHTHVATEVIEDATHRFITDAERILWNSFEAEIDGKANLAGGNTFTGDQIFGSQLYAPSIEGVPGTSDSVLYRNEDGKVVQIPLPPAVSLGDEPEDGNTTVALSLDGAFDALAPKVEGPASAVNNGLMVYDQTTGKLAKSPSGGTYDGTTLTVPQVKITGQANGPLEADADGDVAAATSEQIDLRPAMIKAWQAKGGRQLAETLLTTYFGTTSGTSGTGVTMTDARLIWFQLDIYQDMTITGVGFQPVGTTVADYVGDANNKVAICQIQGTNMVRLGQSTDSANMWKGAVDVYFERNLSAPVTVTIANGPVFVAVLWNASTTTLGPAILSNSGNARNQGSLGFTANRFHGYFISNQTDIASSYALSSLSSHTERRWFTVY